MPTTTLYLVRHGEAHESTEDDPGLTDLGRRQAQDVGARLNGIDVPVVHHSSRRRAIETAAIIAQQLEAAEPAIAQSAEDLTPYPDDWELVPNHYHERLRQVPTEERWIGLEQANGGLSVIQWQNRDPPRLPTFNETTI